jgi:histidyl-tRNA synthetase
MKYRRPKGTKDILPSEIHKWHYLESVIREVTALFNFREIRTPTFELTELFTRGIGSETDIVGKEMYTFPDKSGNSLTLKPEGTANVVRAYLENGLEVESPFQKLYYITNMFRYEKPQEGRYREHTQFGAEIIGSDNISTDVELIMLANEVFNRVGINDYTLKINSIGKIAERKNYIEKLRAYLKDNIEVLSDDSKRRFETNPLRILDSKEKNDIAITTEAPKILDSLSKSSRERFDNVINMLTKFGVRYEIDFRLVRGLDYYTDTTFEFISKKLGSQDAIGGGGRYDGLIESLGGKPAPGAGFGCGMERIIIIADKNGFDFPVFSKLKVFFIGLTEEARNLCYKLVIELRRKKISCDFDSLNRSFKAQMREANKLNSEFVYIIGENEMINGTGQLKRMSDGTQTPVEFSKLSDYFTDII